MSAAPAIAAKPLAREKGNAFPVTVVCLCILLAWYLAAIPMNWVITGPKIEAAGGGLSNILAFSWNDARPVIPAPHQIAQELWKSVFTVAPWSVKSLLYHGWITLSSTLVGFVLGSLLGVALAIAIVHSTFLSKSLMPWIIASQTIPILAIAPMVIVVLGSIGFTGRHHGTNLQYLYTSQVLWKLRFPSSVPFLFTSLKVAVAIALTGAIVGELPTGAIAGIGARLLQGSYYGQTVQIWAALFMGSFLAATLVWLVGAAERVTLRRMGVKP